MKLKRHCCAIICHTVALVAMAQCLTGCTLFNHNAPVPIAIHAETRPNPPHRRYIAQVDLTVPTLHLHVASGGPDPDGPGKWQTLLLEPTRIADRDSFNFVINGDFFTAKGVNDGEGTNSHFAARQWATVA